MTINKIYLGDAVYVENLGDCIKLTTSDGIRDNNIIYLEYDIMERLRQWYQGIKDAKL